MEKILCFGDSNTWGYNPVTKGRFAKDIRWTGLLQNRFNEGQIQILEEGLCGRTTIFEDETREGRKGIDSLPEIFAKYESVDRVILMLGTNDCKTFNHSNPKEIAQGIDACLEYILQYVPEEKVLLLSPIYLGEEVWKDEFDPEFNQGSVELSKELKSEYFKIAQKRGIHFLAASDYVTPSIADQEHLNEEGHQILADVIGCTFLDGAIQKRCA